MTNVKCYDMKNVERKTQVHSAGDNEPDIAPTGKREGENKKSE